MNQNFRRSFREFVEDQRNGLLLDARTFRRSSGQRNELAAFRISSGRLQRTYITLWGLFGNEEIFDQCITQLAAIAISVRKEHGFDFVFSCTSTAKHLMEHLHAKIEEETNPVEARYLGPYPFQDFFQSTVLDFREKKVLIVTDVFATGTLSRHLASVVTRLGGSVVAILSVVSLVDGDDIVSTSEEFPLTEAVRSLKAAAGTGEVPVYALTSVSIPALGADECDNSAIVPIDPVTILPDEYSGQRWHCAFSISKTAQHLERSNAAVFGLHEFDGRMFTTAVRLPELLETCGAEIWKRIKARFPEAGILATTFGRDDMLLHRFVKQHLLADNGHAWSSLFIPRTDATTLDYSYFLAPADQDRLENRHVVLLLSSMRTAEKVTKLVSLLALKPIAELSVICLLNRMGQHTGSFIARIRMLMRGVRTSIPAGTADDKSAEQHRTTFHFVSLYSLPDLDTYDLAGMNQIVNTLSDEYLAQAKDPGFRGLLAPELNLFRPRSITDRKFQEYRAPMLPSAQDITLDGEVTTIQNRDVFLYAITSEAVAKRSFRDLIQHLPKEEDKRVLYQLYAILLADLSFLRTTGQFLVLRDTLITTIREVRQSRC